ncbi:hypothetical protein [Paraglaciecola aestuariivivens]
MSSVSLQKMPNQFDAWLSKLNRFFWPTEQSVDDNSTAFYVFKPFPKNLKKSEIKPWAELQTNTLSPFSKGDKYQFISREGLHLWVSNTKLSGVPETAAQTQLNDGEHYIKGKFHTYLQNWQGGLMQTCVAVEDTTIKSNAVKTIQLDAHTPWAVERKIDTKIKQPSTWLALCFFIGLCGLAWGIFGYATLYFQSTLAEQQSNALSDSIGDKLSLQNTLRNNQQIVSQLQNWHTAAGFFPESFTAVAEKLSQQGEWQVNTVIWQNKIIELEFVSKQVDITSLVGELEKLTLLEQVNIRPHNAENTWILEAKLK